MTIKQEFKFVASIKALSTGKWPCLKFIYNVSPQALYADCKDECPYRQQLQFEVVSFIAITTKHVIYPKGTCGSR